MRSVSLPAFAKINLDLRVLGTRPDGFHDLKTVFQSLALFDNVTVTARRGPFTVTCDEPDIPTDRRNLVWKAASLLHRVSTGKSSAPRDIAIDLRKRVPAQAGLGGGSSDAAMTLLALNAVVETGSRSRHAHAHRRAAGRRRAVTSSSAAPRWASDAATISIRSPTCLPCTW